MDKSAVDIKAIYDFAPDTISRVLSSILVSIAGLKRFNNFYNSLKIKAGEDRFAYNVLKSLDISVSSKRSLQVLDGPTIFIVPIVSGLLELISAIYFVIERYGGDKVKILTLGNDLKYLDILSCYSLASLSDSKVSILFKSINHLNSGGALVCFVPMTPFMSIVDLNDILVPCRLASYTSSSVVNLAMDFETNVKYSWSTIFGDLVYKLFSVRRLFADSGVSLLAVFDKPHFFKHGEIKPESITSSFSAFLNSAVGDLDGSVFNIPTNLKNKFKQLVSRGTKFIHK